MRKASLVLGIISCVFALLLGMFLLLGGVFFVNFMPQLDSLEFSEAYDDMEVYDELYDTNFEMMESYLNIGGYAILGTGIASIVSFLFALVGTILVKKKNVLAGILLLVGALFSFLSLWGFLTAILLVLAGIFALVRDKSVMQEPQSV